MQQIAVDELMPDMVLAEEIQSPEGNVTLGQGTVITELWAKRIATWGFKTIKIKKKSEKVEFDDNELNKMLQAVLQPSIRPKEEAPVKKTAGDSFLKAYNAVESQLCGIFLRTRCNVDLDIKGMEALSKKIADSILTVSGALLFLHLPARGENYLYRHTLDVAVYGGLLARWLKYPDKDVMAIVFAGLLHDIGKANVPYNIISKPSTLSSEEQSAAQNHVAHGIRILTKNNDVPQNVLTAVYQHHERMDGSGYPKGIKGDQIADFAKILAIADVYDALTSDRYYKKAVSPIKAGDIMCNEMAGAFEVEYLNLFLTKVCEQLVGESVVLSNGMKGKIISFNTFPNLQPIVALSGGKTLDLSYCPDISLAKINFAEGM